MIGMNDGFDRCASILIFLLSSCFFSSLDFLVIFEALIFKKNVE